MNNIYVLDVTDSDDNYRYLTLVYTDVNKYEEAIQVIENFDVLWFSDDYESESGSYFEDLEDLLESEGLLNRPKEYSTVYVR